jgi:hypothetical protein
MRAFPLWSSAKAHTGGPGRANVLDLAEWRCAFAVEIWRDVLDHGVADAPIIERTREAAAPP